MLRLAVCFFAVVAALGLAAPQARACTSILVTRGASADGSAMLTYSADAHELYGDLSHVPGALNPHGAMREIIEWDTGKRLGSIPEAPRTYTVIGNMNEHQLAIAESTFGGREELRDPKGVIDYGSLITLALQRAKTAREAIATMTSLVAEHGYASKGESFSIADPSEVWIMEMIGKGPGRKGAVWVARRIPDGYVSAHANQARIRTFPLNDSSSCLYAKDVIALAREKGYFAGKDADFSFADAYGPADEDSPRTCEARVWSVFNRAAPSLKLPTDYVKRKPGAAPVPLWVKPDRKLTPLAVMGLMRDHLEGTEFDLSKGVGAGPYGLPYRWRPLTWKVEGGQYLHERAISTQQTGFSFVSQSRGWLPGPIGGLLWFGVDDTYSTVYMPVYAGVRSVPAPLRQGVATLHRFSWDSAFWVFNHVANLAYGRYRDMIVDVQSAQRELEGGFLERQPAIEEAALKLHAQSPELARDYLTRYAAEQADAVMRRWRGLGEALVVKYMDGNVKNELGKVLHPAYPEDWYRRIVAESGTHFRVEPLPGKKLEAPPAPWSFERREELGPLASQVPADFPFDRERLVLVPGSAQCGQLPRCCAKLKDDIAAAELVAELPEAKPEEQATPCGRSGWLVRVPKAEKRPLAIPAKAP